MNNISKYYPALVELYKEYKDRANALYKEFEARINAIDPNYDPEAGYQPNSLNSKVSNIFSYWTGLQVYPDKPSEGAKLGHESDDSVFYTTYVDGVEFTECVRKG